jgi:hypothetical protein
VTTTSDAFDIFQILDRIQELYQAFALGDEAASDVLRLIDAIITVAEEGTGDPAPEPRMEAGPPTNTRARVLQTAESHVNGARNDDYGDPISDFRTTANFWSEYINRIMVRRPGEALHLLPHDVAAMMMLLKVSRLSWSPEVDDHWIDAAGYAACGFDCVQRESS